MMAKAHVHVFEEGVAAEVGVYLQTLPANVQIVVDIGKRHQSSGAARLRVARYFPHNGIVVLEYECTHG